MKITGDPEIDALANELLDEESKASLRAAAKRAEEEEAAIAAGAPTISYGEFLARRAEKSGDHARAAQIRKLYRLA